MSKKCPTVKQFRWKDGIDNKVELKLPKRCDNCQEDTLKGCLERSWLENGKDPEEFGSITIVNAQNAKHVDVHEAEPIEGEQE